jgi:threonine synthase
MLVDPHTAVGLAVARRSMKAPVPMVTLATAHPAKFSAAVKSAAHVEPPLPPGYPDPMGRAERFTVLANDQGAVERHIMHHSRSLAEKV